MFLEKKISPVPYAAANRSRLLYTEEVSSNNDTSCKSLILRDHSENGKILKTSLYSHNNSWFLSISS
jgi:hypothetical protein